MSNLEFTEILEIEKENIMTACQEYEKYPEYLPDQLPSVKIIKNDYEAKTYEFGSHLEAIWGSSWGTWEAFGTIFRVLGQLEPT